MMRIWRDWKQWLAAPFIITNKEIVVLAAWFILEPWKSNWWIFAGFFVLVGICDYEERTK